MLVSSCVCQAGNVASSFRLAQGARYALSRARHLRLVEPLRRQASPHPFSLTLSARIDRFAAVTGDDGPTCSRGAMNVAFLLEDELRVARAQFADFKLNHCGGAGIAFDVAGCRIEMSRRKRTAVRRATGTYNGCGDQESKVQEPGNISSCHWLSPRRLRSTTTTKRRLTSNGVLAECDEVPNEQEHAGAFAGTYRTNGSSAPTTNSPASGMWESRSWTDSGLGQSGLFGSYCVGGQSGSSSGGRRWVRARRPAAARRRKPQMRPPRMTVESIVTSTPPVGSCSTSPAPFEVVRHGAGYEPSIQ